MGWLDFEITEEDLDPRGPEKAWDEITRFPWYKKVPICIAGGFAILVATPPGWVVLIFILGILCEIGGIKW